MLYMALTLSSISILSRILLMLIYIYLFLYETFVSTLNVALFAYAMYTLVPTMAIFVIYSFNKMFREEFNKSILRKKTETRA